MNPKTPLFVHRVFLPCLNDLINKLRNTQHILVCLRGQAQHEIELYIVPSAGEGLGAGVENFFLRQILVDDIPQALGARFRGEGQAAFAHRLQLLHQLPGEIVSPQGRD